METEKSQYDVIKINSFHLDLVKHLKNINSEKINDPDFIQQINEGFNQNIALEEANQILLEGLSYSHNNILQKIIENEYPEFSEGKKNNLIKSILPYCSQIFKQYGEISPQAAYFEQMYSELASVISIFLEE